MFGRDNLDSNHGPPAVSQSPPEPHTNIVCHPSRVAVRSRSNIVHAQHRVGVPFAELRGKMRFSESIQGAKQISANIDSAIDGEDFHSRTHTNTLAKKGSHTSIAPLFSAPL